ncbi:(2Fe-2S)-binding protein [Methylomonas sp. UP202]|uniref:(2Fe-2S)-binding protein n=1 Tax=Methylomonas sp. UP202 TaxID=3040943 RepID=UPI00247A82F4|nr:(2Fe-2S)-binding protein [Methylomonas sp. UP202]WGS86382.1 (2Fe-2S)-binding protein [Methylomonas sp. UP202]
MSLDQDDVLCFCSGTTRRQVEQLIADGVTDPERVSRVTGAASGCGGCEYEFEQLFKADARRAAGGA